MPRPLGGVVYCPHEIFYGRSRLLAAKPHPRSPADPSAHSTRFTQDRAGSYLHPVGISGTFWVICDPAVTFSYPQFN